MSERISKALARRKDGEKGFTLIELLVVVIIIGILAAIAIPVYLNMRQGAWRSSVESDVNNAALTLESAMTQNNGSLDGVTISTPDGTTGDITLSGKATGTITISDGNTLTITKTNSNKAYTILGKNDNLDQSITYNSETGGLGSWTDSPAQP